MKADPLRFKNRGALFLPPAASIYGRSTFELLVWTYGNALRFARHGIEYLGLRTRGKRIRQHVHVAAFRRQVNPRIIFRQRHFTGCFGNGNRQRWGCRSGGKVINAIRSTGFYDADIAVLVNDQALWLVQRHTKDCAGCGTWGKFLDATTGRRRLGAIGNVEIA